MSHEPAVSAHRAWEMNYYVSSLVGPWSLVVRITEQMSPCDAMELASAIESELLPRIADDVRSDTPDEL